MDLAQFHGVDVPVKLKAIDNLPPPPPVPSLVEPLPTRHPTPSAAQSLQGVSANKGDLAGIKISITVKSSADIRCLTVTRMMWI